MKMRTVLPVILLAVLTAGGIAASDGDWLEPNIDRPGSDYRDFDLPDEPGTDAGLKQCMVSCEEDGRCVAFTYVKAGVQGPTPRCWLKDHVAAAVADDCCTSWVKNGAGSTTAAEPPANWAVMTTIELRPNINLQGSDYRDFEMAATGTPEMCRDACQSESQCRSFTYTKAGPRGAVPHCWLKNTAPEAYSDEECVSGVKP